MARLIEFDGSDSKNQAFELIANIAYRDTKVVEIKSISNLPTEFVKTTRSIFLWSDSYSQHPIKFEDPNNQGEIGIRQLECGPLINIHLPRTYERDGKHLIGRGDIYYPPYFINPNTDRKYSPSDNLRRAFKSLKACVQKAMVKIYWQPYKQSPYIDKVNLVEPVYIGKNAFELLKTGQYYLLSGKDSWFTITELHDDRDSFQSS